MNKRAFKMVAIAVLVVVCLFATTLVTACNKQSTYYLSTKSNNWATYDKDSNVPVSSRFVQNADGTYTLAVDLDAGDSFAIYKVGKNDNLVQDIFSSAGKLTLEDGKVVVGEKGKYVLTIDVSNGELTYTFTAAQQPGPSTVAVTGVKLAPTTLNMTVGGADQTLTATVEPSNATNKNVSWSTSDSQVATVAGGVVHAVGAGDATITVTTADGNKTATCAVHVTAGSVDTPVAVTGVTLDPTTLNMTVGGADQTLTATVAPSNATNKNVSWSSSDSQVATVADGVVHAVGAGDATITVTTADGNKTATCEVHVSAPQAGDVDVEMLYFEEDDFTLTVGQDATLTVVVEPANATDKSFTWTVDNDGIVDIELAEGGIKVTAAAVGTATITLVSTSTPTAESYPITITVVAPTAESITVEPTSLELEVGDQRTLVATVLPAGVNPILSWTSSNPSCVSVDDFGHIEALAVGSAVITVAVNASIQATCTVTVVQHVQSISLSETSLEMYQGGSSRDITVEFNPTSATNKGFSAVVTSGNEYVSITFDVEAGTITVTPVAVGSAVITVTSTDGGFTATCNVEVKALSDAKPQLSSSTITVDKGDTSDAISITAEAGLTISSFTVTSAQTAIATVTKGSDNSFTVTGVAFGQATVTVNVTYTGGSSSSAALTLTVYVSSDYYYLTGTVDGGAWGSQESETAARNANLLLEKMSDGVYELTRDIDISKGTKLYILPSNLGDNWGNQLKAISPYYTADSAASSWGITVDDGNAVISISGNYTVRLTLTTSGARWTVVPNWKAPTSATVNTDQVSLENNGDVTTANLTLTIGPDGAKYDASDIEWSVDAQYVNWLKLTPNADATKCVAELIYFEGDATVTVTVTVTITVGSFKLTAICDITLMPEGADTKPVTDVIWETANATVDIASDGWTFTVKAKADGDITGVTYELVSNLEGGAWTEIYANDDGKTVAFTIDSATGVITANMFGTVFVKATSVGVNSEGNTVSKVTSVTFYANTFYLDIDWSNDDATTNAATGVTEFKWSGVELNAGSEFIILYANHGWAANLIRSASYVDTANSNNVSGGVNGAQGKIKVSVAGEYDITLNLSGLKPSVTVKFVRELQQDPVLTVAIYGDGTTWQDDPYASGSAQIGPIGGNYTVTFEHTFNEAVITGWSGTGYIAFQVVVGSTWGGGFSNLTITLDGSTNNMWDSGTGKFSFAKSVISGKTLRFTCTFNESSVLKSIAITTVS